MSTGRSAFGGGFLGGLLGAWTAPLARVLARRLWRVTAAVAMFGAWWWLQAGWLARFVVLLLVVSPLLGWAARGAHDRKATPPEALP